MVNWRRAYMIMALTASTAAGGAPGAPADGPAHSNQSPGVAGMSLSDYARELDDERFDTREAATRRLIEDARIQTDDIMEFVRAQWETLAPEAAERFLIVARQRSMVSPGAIGIEFGPSPIATVENVIAGAPASKALQRGDRLLSLNGQDLPQSSAEQRPELLRRMAGLKAGDIVKVHIQRGLEELDVEFALADPRLLPRFESFIVSMQREMLVQWNATCEQRLPPPQHLMIDMGVVGISAADLNPRSASAEIANEAIIEALSRRRVEASRHIARILEQSSATDSPQRRRELENEYLPLINEFARLNARLRLVEPLARARGR